MPNVWDDFVDAGVDNLTLEETALAVQRLYRIFNMSPGWGRPINGTQYDGADPALNIRSAETVTSPFAHLQNHNASVTYDGDNAGNRWAGPWSHAGAGTITGNVNMTGNLNITGTLHATGAVDFDSTLNVDGAVTLQTTLHGIGAVDFDSTVNVDGAVTFQTTLHGVGAVDFDSTLNVDGAATFNGAVTLGNAAADVISIPGTANFAEDVTLAKGLIVDTTTLIVDEATNRVSVLTASPQVAFEVAGRMRSSASEAIPTSGAGIEMTYTAGQSYIVSRDYTAGTYMPLNVFASLISLAPGAVKKFEANTTGVGFFATTPVAQQTGPAAVAEGTADATYGNSERDSINEHSVALNVIRDILLAYGLAN